MVTIKPHHTHVIISGRRDNPDSAAVIYATDDEGAALDMAAIMMRHRPHGDPTVFQVMPLADDSKLP